MFRSTVLCLLLSCTQGFTPVPLNRALHRAPPVHAEADLVPVNDGNVKVTVAAAGFAAGAVVAGPVGGVIGSAAANYIANKEGEVGETTQAAGKTVLMLYNILLKANSKLELSDKASAAASNAIDEAKTGASGETVVKITDAVDAVLAKSAELDKEYAIVAALKDLLGKAGDLSIEAIDKALKYADENDIAGKAAEAAKNLAEKGKSSA